MKSTTKQRRVANQPLNFVLCVYFYVLSILFLFLFMFGSLFGSASSSSSSSTFFGAPQGAAQPQQNLSGWSFGQQQQVYQQQQQQIHVGIFQIQFVKNFFKMLFFFKIFHLKFC